jgi:outer membrane protein insertion porin family
MARLFQVAAIALCCLGCLFLQTEPARAAEAPGTNAPAKPAVLKISGYGILGNRELKRTLRTLELAGKKPGHFGAAFIEDSALIISARVKRDGFLDPRIQIRLVLADGSQIHTDAQRLLDEPLPRPLRIVRAEFRVHKGRLFYYESLSFEGLKVLPLKKARSYFIETEALFGFKRMKIYTPERLHHALNNLSEELDRLGYQEARAQVVSFQQDDHTGGVRVRVRIQEGPQHWVRTVREEVVYETNTVPGLVRVFQINKPYSRLWEQDFSLGLRTNHFKIGYPDTTVSIKKLQSQNTNGIVNEDLLAEVKTGPRVWINSVRFEGQQRTRTGLMARRARVQRGELLDRSRVEDGRYRLAQLGVFQTVDLSYHRLSEHDRDVIYSVKEGKWIELYLLFGYGSYELLRGGVEADIYNLWGLAHNARIKAVQSFKASSGEFTYNIPELVGRDIDLFLHASALRRQEISFLRQEYGGGLGVHKYFQDTATDLSVRYNYQILDALQIFRAVATEGLTNPAVGSIIVDLKHDLRDNPLYPRRGYKVFSTQELGTSYLGGEANYERLEMSPSWHHPLGGGRYLSLGLSHGFAISFGSPAHNLPFNRRFFPGGDNSIRGYQLGEASPRNEQNQLVGAETYTLGTVEFEQALTPKWSLVAFSDSLGEARRLDHYPFDTGLFSVGGGIRWKTIIGPVRLEYGYNLNPRPKDPSGTLHFSLGFPF